MPNLTQVTLTSGVPTAGSGTVSTIDALMALIGEVLASPTSDTLLDRLKTLHTDLDAKIGGQYNSVLPTLNSGDKSIPSLDVNAIAYVHQGDLTPATDSVQAQIVSGVLWDAAGNQMTVKTAKGTASSSGVNAAVAAVTSKKIRVLSYSLQAANANSTTSVTANWQDDSGSPVVLSQLWDFIGREGVSKSPSPGSFFFQTTAGQALKLNLSAALSVYWEITYVEAA